MHDAYPDKHIYFTEQWVGSKSAFAENLPWHVRTLLIGATRNWARTVLEWNLAADPQQNPHTPGGCTECRGALTLAGDTVTREDAYYIIAHASKFVRPGSVRIASTASATPAQRSLPHAHGPAGGHRAEQLRQRPALRPALPGPGVPLHAPGRSGGDLRVVAPRFSLSYSYALL